MPQLNISNLDKSGATSTVDDYSVDTKTTDGVMDQDETVYTNSKWPTWFGYYKSIADLKSAIDLKSIWVVGKGWTADNKVSATLDNISGWGNDSFTDILINMNTTMLIGGDAFAEVMRDDKGNLINLKPIDAGSINIVVNKQGRIKRYEQTARTSGTPKNFKPNDILHFSNKRIADEIHGQSAIEALEENIKANAENFADLKKLNHHQVRPFILWKLKTDNTTKIQEIITKINAARNLGEDMFIPDDDDAIEHEIVQANISSGVFTWRDDLRNSFYRAIGLPQIIPGAGGQSTESEGKVIFLAHEVIVSSEQRYIEETLWNQLAIRIKLNAPPSIEPKLQQDQAKDAGQTGFQPSDTQAGVGR
jgi:hypothetical protein